MKNHYLKILFLANGVFVCAASLLGPILAIFLEGFNANIVEIGFTSTIFMISTGIFLIILSLWGDRFKQKNRFLVLGFLIRCLAWFCFIFVDQLWQIYLLQVILGLGEAIGSTFFNVVFAEHLDEGHHVQDYSVWKLIESFVAGLAATLGGIIVSFWGFDTLFGIMAVLSVVSTFIFVYGMRKSDR